MKKEKVIKTIRRIIFIILCITFVSSLIFLIGYFMKIHKSEKTIDSIKQIVEETDANKDKKRDLSALYKENNDFVGWITIKGTNIDYPVMQNKKDEQFYLHRNFYREYDFAGTPFCAAIADVDKPSDNILIYGHHLNAGTMFTQIEKYEDVNFYKEHKYINFDTLKSDGTYEIIAAFRTDVHEGTYPYYEFADGTKEEFDEYVNNTKSLTPYNIETAAEYGDKLISLSKCAYHTYNGRFVVVAKRIKEIK